MRFEVIHGIRKDISSRSDFMHRSQGEGNYSGKKHFSCSQIARMGLWQWKRWTCVSV